METSNEIMRKLEELKPYLRQHYAVSKIGLFGSFVNGTPTEKSDIDLLVEFEKPIGWRFYSLEMYLEEIFRRKVDLVTRTALKEQIAASILRQLHYV